MMQWCARHRRVRQPATRPTLSRHGRVTPAVPAHWRPIALGVLQEAARWAMMGQCALPVEERPCDLCQEEERTHP